MLHRHRSRPRCSFPLSHSQPFLRIRQIRGRSERVTEKWSIRESSCLEVVTGRSGVRNVKHTGQESSTPQLEFLETIPLRVILSLVIFCAGYFSAISGVLHSPLDLPLLPVSAQPCENTLCSFDLPSLHQKHVDILSHV